MRDVLVAGDGLSFTTTVTDYPASEGWTLCYRLVPRFTSPTQAPIQLTAVTFEVDDYEIEVVPGTTATWAAGQYGWASWVEKTGQRVTLESGELKVQPDPAQTTAGTDYRSDAQVALADAQAALKAWKPTTKRYKINGREMEFNSVAEILQLISYWERQIAKELNASRMAAGLPNSRKTFGRVARV